MTNNKSIIAVLVLLAVLVFLGWFFWDILLYIFIAIFLSLLGTPLMRLLTRIHIRKRQFPESLAAAITLLVIIAVLGLLCYLIVPAIIRELTFLASLDPSSLSHSFEVWINKLDPMLRKFGIVKHHQHTFGLVVSEWGKFIEQVNFSSLLSNTFSAAGTVLIAIFSILFMTFFSLKDHRIFFKMIQGWIPTKYRQNFSNILNATCKQVSSYFLGVFCEMMIVGILDTIFCVILKIPSPMLIGIIGGFLNIIPYVGPLIAGISAVVISITSLLPSDPSSALLMTTLVKAIVAIGVTKLIDDFVLQPYIYGKRTHTHPLEIFIVILMAGYVGGVFAMIFAVPAYTLIRIVTKEFFGAYFMVENEPAESGTSAVPEKDQTAGPTSEMDV